MNNLTHALYLIKIDFLSNYLSPSSLNAKSPSNKSLRRYRGGILTSLFSMSSDRKTSSEVGSGPSSANAYSPAPPTALLGRGNLIFDHTLDQCNQIIHKICNRFLFCFSRFSTVAFISVVFDEFQ